MASTRSVLASRLKFLLESTRLLAEVSPSTSSFLGFTCNDLIVNNELEPSGKYQGGLCGACGSVILFGRTTSARIAHPSRLIRGAEGRKITRPVTFATAKPSIQDEKIMVYTCLVCFQQTRTCIGPSPTRATVQRQRSTVLHRSAVQKPSAATMGKQTSVPVAINVATKASGKQRAKIRKQGHLHAVLLKHKEAATRHSSTGYGLDLLDLMKHS